MTDWRSLAIQYLVFAGFCALVWRLARTPHPLFTKARSNTVRVCFVLFAALEFLVVLADQPPILSTIAHLTLSIGYLWLAVLIRPTADRSESAHLHSSSVSRSDTLS
jgi:hypothetical protein